MIKVFFRSRQNHKKLDELGPDEYRIELRSNTWDDYQFKTTFNVELHGHGFQREFDQVKILFDKDKISAKYLVELIDGGWDGYFPLQGGNYISNPTQVTFYEEMISVVGIEDAAEVARVLGDASYHIMLLEDEAALHLSKIDGFRTSLQRERSEQIAFAQGWKAFREIAISIEDIEFEFLDRENTAHAVTLRYSEENSVLPRDINLLIGPNGAGKSEFLRQMVEDWLESPISSKKGFSGPPGFTRLIAVSYSPFERLRIDIAELDRIDLDAYTYFGLRGRTSPGPPRENLSLEHAKQASVSSLISCIADDRRFGAIKAWSQKIKILNSVLGHAIDFDFLAMEVPSSMIGGAFLTEEALYPVDPMVRDEKGKKLLVRIDEETSPVLSTVALEKHVRRAEGVTFFKDGVPVSMSSGQRLFSYIVINILGAIRRNSLIIIDEPELFLHPSLEVSLISMLKAILDNYSCKALIATHSALITREVPRDCVHVFHWAEDGLQIHHPPFQTFGADVQRISSYVFRDNATPKPFERWIATKSKEMGGKDQLLAALSPHDLNEELTIELMAGGEQFE
ncbi:AAA family ATPase [Agrobacterium burrii]|uniref:ATP-binding protein n=1 Tax=Agrobacterium burrii TaxID=2815339 RepID=A0ABS3ERI4_9HYPH|nr:AAA family ATPase [Agrobacterium burrii]MBO0134633.1 ATP-binding protein [Agrobacterium burrii]